MANTNQKFFRLVPDNPNFPFVKYSHVFAGFSIVLTFACIIFLFTHGLNYGVDFKGGTEVYLRFKAPQTVESIRSVLTPLGYTDSVVQSYGDDTKNEFLVRVESKDLQLKSMEGFFHESLDPLDESGKTTMRIAEDRIYVTYSKPVEIDKIKAALSAAPSKNVEIENINKFGRSDQNEYNIQFAAGGTQIVRALQNKFGQDGVEVLQVDEIGQKVGSELRQQAVGAVIISMILILVYIWFRFDFEFAPGAILALVHDVMVILGVFAFFKLPFDLSSIAAVLTIVGYSINDTIVAYDRVRENMKKVRSMNFADIVNLSINETLGRTVLISATVLMATVILYFYGGPITKYFALALTVGVISGTYSTICVASPVTIYLRKYFQKKV